MLFNSHIFLLIFLPVTLAGYFLLARAWGPAAARLWLTLASFAFYAWAGWQFLPLLIGSTLVNFVVGRALVARAREHVPTHLLLAVGVTFNLLLLGYFKYAGFFDANLFALTGASLDLGAIVLPIGISFYTFTQIAFLADAARGEAAEYELSRYALFVSFFPHLIAGPIIHHKEMMPQFAEAKTYRWSADNMAAGLTMFTLGLFKKVALADQVSPFAVSVFTAADHGYVVGLGDAWIGVLAYTLQIYFDFSAYSDMAIGLARMFGIKLPLNFNSPYKARSIIEFWRRWHMTLSRFLRDYLYFSLGGNRKGPARRYLNLMITMLLGGLWHGANWTFVIWGGLHGLYLMIDHAWRAGGGRMPKLVAWLITFLAVVFAWVFFRAETVSGAMDMFRGLFGLSGQTGLVFTHVNAIFWVVLLLAVALFAPNTQEIMRTAMPAPFYNIAPPSGVEARIRWRATVPIAIVISLVLLFAIWLVPHASEFLYFQF